MKRSLASFHGFLGLGYAPGVRPATRRSIVALLAGFGLAACVASPTTARLCLDGNGVEYECVAIVGRLVEFREEGGFLIGGASFFGTSRAGNAIAAGVTDGSGGFVADGFPTNTEVALAFMTSGFAPAVFSGETAERDSFLFTGYADVVGEGLVPLGAHQDPIAVAQAFVDEYSAAVLGTGSLMTLGTSGGAIVRGRITRLVDPEDLSFENVGGATVEVIDGAGTPYTVYYRDGDSDVDPLATATHASDARFAAFAVSASGADPVFGIGLGAVTVRVTFEGREAEEQTFVLENGITEFDFFAAP